MADEDESIPVSKLSRTGVAASAAVRAGAKKLGHLTRQPFLSAASRETSRREHQEAVAKIFFAAGGRLKGVALKLAQMMSMEAEMLPEAVRDELKKACHQAPPINRALVRKIVRTQLGAPPEEKFLFFDTRPFAAASLGQVHRARAKTGRELAVKIQYPGIAETIRSDLGLMRRVARSAPLPMELEGLLREVEERLIEETDYTQEAETTRWFGAHLKMEGIRVPEVMPDYSGKALLSTAFLEGRHIDAWLSSAPDQSLRNSVGQLLADLLSRSLNELNRIHADPNAGNFLITDRGELGLIDFGCVVTPEDGFAESFRGLLRNYYHDTYDPDRLRENYAGIGISFASEKLSSSEFREVLRPWAEWWRELLSPAGCDFSQPGLIFRGVELRRSLAGYFADATESSGSGTLAFLDRTLHGTFRLFERLGAKVKLNLI